VVIDHGAKPLIRDGLIEPWAGDMARLAQQSPVLCKVSGLVTEAKQNWEKADLSPYIAHLFTHFGPDRLIFGSDWPVVTLASSYARWIETVREEVGHWTQDQQAAFFSGNATRVYRLGS
jgi:L-fuconolactonase